MRVDQQAPASNLVLKVGVLVDHGIGSTVLKLQGKRKTGVRMQARGVATGVPEQVKACKAAGNEDAMELLSPLE